MAFKKPQCLIIFAKTPGLTPAKTRLAAKTSITFAEQFFRLSLACTAFIARQAQISLQKDTLDVHWALAEENGPADNFWQELASSTELQLPDKLEHTQSYTWTGEGDLGQRLARVYTHFRKKYDKVLCIGSDCPQLPPELIKQALSKLNKDEDIVFSPANDGGFILFGARAEIPKSCWTEVEYSKSNTLTELSHKLEEQGLNLHYLQAFNDVDELTDLEDLIKYWNKQYTFLSHAQKCLKAFLSQR